MASLKDRKYIFWLDDINVLFKNNNYLDFFPRYESSREEQLNSITRFAIYLLTLSIILNLDEKYIYISLTLVVFTILFHTINMADPKSKEKDVNKTINDRIEQRENEKNKNIYNEPNNYVDSDTNISDYSSDNNNNISLEVGYQDSSGNTIIGKDYDKECYKCVDTRPIHTYEEIESYKKGTCRKPTENNPFMNPNIMEFNDGEIPAACNVDDDEIKEQMEYKYDNRLFKNIDDVWDIENSRRQFYTIPAPTVPNNQTEFANWLYKTPCTCKEDNHTCEFNEYLRYKR